MKTLNYENNNMNTTKTTTLSNNLFRMYPEFAEQMALLGYSNADKIHIRALQPKEISLDEAQAIGQTWKTKDGKPVKNSYEFYIQRGQLYRKWGNRYDSANLAELAQINQYCGIYIIPNKGGTKNAEITEANTLFYECDDISKDEQWEKLRALEATAGVKATVVETAKSLHCYFHLDQPCTDLKEWATYQERLILTQHSDGSIKNAARLMRAAGFNHVKWLNGQHVYSPVRLQQKSAETVSLHTFDGILEALHQPKVTQHHNANVALGRKSDGWVGNGTSMLDIGPYQLNWNNNGRELFATFQCPVHVSTGSTDHVHVHRETGRWTTHCECDRRVIFSAALNLAKSQGFVEKITPKAAKKAAAKELHQKYNGLGCYKPDIVLNQNKLVIPKLIKGINYIISACKTGKTTGISEIIKNFVKDGKRVLISTYRNGLIRQTCEKSGARHIHEFKKNTGSINTAPAVGFCPDSCHLIQLPWIEAGMLLVIDEADATMRHILNGDTLGDDQEYKIAHFRAVIQKVLDMGGYVVLMEDGMNSTTIDAYTEMIGARYPKQIVVNEKQLSHWDVVIGQGSSSGLVQDLFVTLGSGDKAIVVADSQSFLENVERVITNNGEPFKVLRVDSKTSEEPYIKEFMGDPDGFLSRNEYELVLISPTAESGVSIWHEGYSTVYGYFTHSEPRQAIQMLERYRLDVPRKIYCQSHALGAKSIIARLDPAAEIERLNQRYADTIERARVIAALATEASEVGINLNDHDAFANYEMRENDENSKIFNKLYVEYRCQSAAAKYDMLGNLTQALIDRGHNVVELKWSFDKGLNDEIKIAKEEILNDEAISMSQADGTRYTPEEATKKLKDQDLNAVDRLDCRRTILEHKLPGYDLNDVEKVKFVIKGKGKNVSALTLRHYMKHPEVAAASDRRIMTKRLNKGSFQMLHRTPAATAKAELLAGYRPYIEWLVSNQFSENSPILEAFYNRLLMDAELVLQHLDKEILPLQEQIRTPEGKVVQQAVTRVSQVKKILTVIGYKLNCAKRGGEAGDRVRIYEVSNRDCEFSREIMESFMVRDAEVIAESGSQYVMSTKSSINNELLENVDAGVKVLDWMEKNPGATLQKLAEITSLTVEAIKKVVQTVTLASV